MVSPKRRSSDDSERQKDREAALDKAMSRREKRSKLQLWAFVIWTLGLLLIVAKYMRFFD